MALALSVAGRMLAPQWGTAAPLLRLLPRAAPSSRAASWFASMCPLSPSPTLLQSAPPFPPAAFCAVRQSSSSGSLPVATCATNSLLRKAARIVAASSRPPSVSPSSSPSISSPSSSRPLSTSSSSTSTSILPSSIRTFSAASTDTAAGAAPTPSALGFRMPGEFERHAGTWMSFPYDPTIWRNGAAPAQRAMAGLAAAIAQFEPVWMLADPQVADVARSHFQGVSGVEVVEIPTNDVWIRDWGPTCVVRDDPASGRREVAAVRWDYNCYGAPIKMAAGLPVLMSDWSKDRAAGRSLPGRHGLRAFDCPLHLEGGSVHSDGQGTLLVTEECLLHPSRNPHLGRTRIEAQLCAQLGASKVLWLPRGMAGDEEGTNGHVDNVACFSEPGTVLLAWAEHPDDPAAAVAAQNLAALRGATDAAGRPVRVVKVPCPEPPVAATKADVTGLAAAAAGTGYGKVYELEAGVRLPGSYLNHYIVNGGVVVPQFGGEHSRSDAAALEVLSAAYPGRKVVGVQTRELLLNGGNVHCLTQQLPAAQ